MIESASPQSGDEDQRVVRRCCGIRAMSFCEHQRGVLYSDAGAKGKKRRSIREPRRFSMLKGKRRSGGGRAWWGHRQWDNLTRVRQKKKKRKKKALASFALGSPLIRATGERYTSVNYGRSFRSLLLLLVYIPSLSCHSSNRRLDLGPAYFAPCQDAPPFQFYTPN